MIVLKSCIPELSPCKNANEGKQSQPHIFNRKTYASKRKPDFVNIGLSSTLYLSFTKMSEERAYGLYKNFT